MALHQETYSIFRGRPGRYYGYEKNVVQSVLKLMIFISNHAKDKHNVHFYTKKVKAFLSLFHKTIIYMGNT